MLLSRLAYVIVGEKYGEYVLGMEPDAFASCLQAWG